MSSVGVKMSTSRVMAILTWLFMGKGGDEEAGFLEVRDRQTLIYQYLEKDLIISRPEIIRKRPKVPGQASFYRIGHAIMTLPHPLRMRRSPRKEHDQ